MVLTVIASTVFSGATPAMAIGPSVNQTSGTGFSGWTGQALVNHPTYSVSGFSGTPTFTISPALPSGLTLDPATGSVTGTPTVGIDTTTFTVTATYNSETASAVFDLTIVQNITVSSSLNNVGANASNTAAINLSFANSSIVNNTNGVVSVVVQNATPVNTSSCSGVSLSPTPTGSCTLAHSGSDYTYTFEGVNLSTASTQFTLAFGIGTLTAGASGYLWLNVNIANGLNLPSLNAGAPSISIGFGQNQQQQNQSTPFTAGVSISSIGSSASFSTLAVGANSPGFTSTFSGYSGGAVIDQVNFLLGDPYNGVFWSVPGAVGQTYVNWNPSGTNCGISAIRIGGVAQTSSSGITCMKATSGSSPVQYWLSFKLSTPTTAEISYDVAPGAFIVTQAGNYNFFSTLFDNAASPRKIANITQAFDAAPQSQSTPADLVSFTLPVAVGQRIVGEPVTVSATDLALSTDYSVVLRSTPQVLAQGRTVSSSFNTSVTIPDNLEAGWHSITFSATRSDGSALEEKVYFKISADGTLLATSNSEPAELALTGIITAGAIPLSLIVLVMGFIAFFVAREINPDFMRVMTLTRNAQGELDFVKRRIRSDEF